jgi:hypothetical protein
VGFDHASSLIVEVKTAERNTVLLLPISSPFGNNIDIMPESTSHFTTIQTLHLDYAPVTVLN